MCSGSLYTCKAKGVFRSRKIRPLVGDIVKIRLIGKEGGIIEDILPRKNQLIRPAIANIDQLVIVAAVKNPAPDFLLIDKLIVNCSFMHIPVLICINKVDLDENNNSLFEIYKDSGCELMSLSAATGVGMDRFKSFLEGRVSVLAGNSGVGKTSILNRLGFDMEVGDISKIHRGRHTTRHSELYPVPSVKCSYIADTPGFSVLDSNFDCNASSLASHFCEFEKYSDCRFDDCIHLSDSAGCMVIEAVKDGKISKSRYNSYLSILEECTKNNMY